MRKYIGFLIIWFSSGFTLLAYQNHQQVKGIIFSLLSLMYFLVLQDKKENK